MMRAGAGTHTSTSGHQVIYGLRQKTAHVEISWTSHSAELIHGIQAIQAIQAILQESLISPR